MSYLEFRIKHSLTQTDMACIVGVSLQTYRMWEKGVSKPNDNNLERLKALYEEKGEVFK